MSDSSDEPLRTWELKEMLRHKQREGIRNLERAAELEHERQLAEIRGGAKALVWLGSQSALITEIMRLHKSGMLQGDLVDVLANAREHFVGPDGKPIIKKRIEKRESPAVTAKVEPKRLTGTIKCPAAARKLESYLESTGIGVTEFAIQAQTTDRTLRSFRKTGKIRRDILDGIAKAMGTTRDALLKG